MNKIIALVGQRKEDNGASLESYQVLVDRSYKSVDYDGTIRREAFLAEVCENFAEFIDEQETEGLVGILNGYKIDPESERTCQINRLEEDVVNLFGDLLSKNIIKFCRGVKIPAASLN